MTKKVSFFFDHPHHHQPTSPENRKRAASAAAPARSQKKNREGKGDRKTVPQNRWETPDGQQIEVTGFCGEEHPYPGVPVGWSRTGVFFDSWDKCLQDVTLLPW
jgi:hypothetical protein